MFHLTVILFGPDLVTISRVFFALRPMRSLLLSVLSYPPRFNLKLRTSPRDCVVCVVGFSIALVSQRIFLLRAFKRQR